MLLSVAASAPTWSRWQLVESLDRSSPVALARLALRNRSGLAADALASAGLAAGCTAAQARRLVLDGDVSLREPRIAAALALVWAGMALDHEAMDAAARLYLRVIEDMGTAQLPTEHQQGVAQALYLSGRFDEVAALLPHLRKISDAVRACLEADLAGPVVRGGEPTARWFEMLSAPQAAFGLEPLRLDDRTDDGLDLFDRLTSRADRGLVSGELVSVVTPCFQPAEGLLTSLRSLAGQTWADLELVVVDDGSGPEYDDWFERARAIDPRVRVIREESNRGAYAVRNRGVEESRGSVVTFQDADDWSHPRRIERQLAVLQEDGVMATRSAAVRARPDLTHQWFGYPPIRPNASSLMMRREAYDWLGPFVETRKGADSEYLERIVARGGVLRDLSEPLAVTRLRDGSLSRGDFTHHWTAPDRLDFRGGFRAWHRGEGGSRAAERTPLFPVPTTFLPTQSRRREVDLLWIADFSPDAASVAVSELAPWVAVSSEANGRQGLWQLESPLPVRSRRPEMSTDWRDTIDSTDGLISVCRTDHVRASLGVVVDPSVLLVCGDQPTDVVIDDIEVWLTPGSLEPAAGGLPIDLLWVADQCRRWWSRAPRWVAAPFLDADERSRLLDLAGSLRLGDTRVPDPVP